jgi:hypothetical protein
MNDEKKLRAQRRKEYMERDYDPGDVSDFDAARLNAAEYTAYQLGQINRKFDRFVEAIERIAASYPMAKP